MVMGLTELEADMMRATITTTTSKDGTWLERRIHNPEVGGSCPPLATNS
jgi:hypothetical protein